MSAIAKKISEMLGLPLALVELALEEKPTFGSLATIKMWATAEDPAWVDLLARNSVRKAFESAWEDEFLKAVAAAKPSELWRLIHRMPPSYKKCFQCLWNALIARADSSSIPDSCLSTLLADITRSQLSEDEKACLVQVAYSKYFSGPSIISRAMDYLYGGTHSPVASVAKQALYQAFAAEPRHELLRAVINRLRNLDDVGFADTPLQKRLLSEAETIVLDRRMRCRLCDHQNLLEECLQLAHMNPDPFRSLAMDIESDWKKSAKQAVADESDPVMLCSLLQYLDGGAHKKLLQAAIRKIEKSARTLHALQVAHNTVQRYVNVKTAEDDNTISNMATYIEERWVSLSRKTVDGATRPERLSLDKLHPSVLVEGIKKFAKLTDTLARKRKVARNKKGAKKRLSKP